MDEKKQLETGKADLPANLSNGSMALGHDPELLDRAMARLWSVMAQIYPRQWQTYGDVDGEIFRRWKAGLAGCTLEQIHHGVKLCQHSGDDFSPELPTFLARCKAKPAINVFTQPKAERTERVTDKTKGRAAIEKIALDLTKHDKPKEPLQRVKKRGWKLNPRCARKHCSNKLPDDWALAWCPSCDPSGRAVRMWE